MGAFCVWPVFLPTFPTGSPCGASDKYCHPNPRGCSTSRSKAPVAAVITGLPVVGSPVLLGGITACFIRIMNSQQKGNGFPTRR